MTGIVVLIAALVGFTTLALWLEHSRADVWSWLYGTTDPRELVDRAHERHGPDCLVTASCEPGDHSYSWPCDYAAGTGGAA